MYGVCFEQRTSLGLTVAVGAAFEAECKGIVAGTPECPAVLVSLTRVSPKLWGHEHLSSPCRSFPDPLLPDTHLCGGPALPAGVLPRPVHIHRGPGGVEAGPYVQG